MNSLIALFFKITAKIPIIFYKIFFAVVAAIIITSFKFDLIEFYLFDLRTSAKAEVGLSKVANPKIVLIYVNSKTIEKHNGNPSFNDHRMFLEKLSHLKNSQIIYNFRLDGKQFVEISGSYQEKFNFNNFVKKLTNVFFITEDMALKGQESDLLLSVPLQDLKMKSAPIANDNKLNSKNPVSRRLILSYENQPLFHYEIATLYNNKISDLSKINGRFEHIGTDQAYITFHPTNTFLSYNFDEVLENKIPMESLENKIILVGMHTSKHIEDYVSTPYSSEAADLITKTELHANIFQTIISNDAPRKVPQPINIFITTLISILTVYVALSVKPSKGIAILLSTFLGFGIFATTLLACFDLWINMAHPFLAIFLCYYFFIPYRLIIENRLSWEYLQKNKLLHQVEELKTNFISMMSHDLKTPIARIQGMTEVILKDSVTLSLVQREALDTIKGSSDDLLKFINSILQYGRIESQGVELHRQAKDINQLLQDAAIDAFAE